MLEMQKATAPPVADDGQPGFLSKTGRGFTNKLSSSLNKISPARAASAHLSQDLQSTSPLLAQGPISGPGPPAFSVDRGSASSITSNRSLSRAVSGNTPSLQYARDKKSATYNALKHTASLSRSVSSRKGSHSRQSSFDSIFPAIQHASTVTSPLSTADSSKATTPVVMSAPSLETTFKKDGDHGKSPSTSSHVSAASRQGSNGLPLPPLPQPPSGPSPSVSTPSGSLQNPGAVYQHIQEMSSKRISTLDYLREAHEGRVYWFNTLLFTKSDLSKMPYFETKRLARRATNYLLLGLSLPAVLDVNTSNPLEYLRSLNALLVEFESYQQIRPPDGSSVSSITRARLPQMFKRGVKGRRSSTTAAADIGLPMSTSDPADLKSMVAAGGSTGSATATSIPGGEQDLLPGEEYTLLLTPFLPFEPDFFETYATLCDVLIDCYTRIMSLVASPAMCGMMPGIGEAFGKADARVRKVIMSGIVKEFEEASRGGIKSEMAGVGKVILGGLM